MKQATLSLVAASALALTLISPAQAAYIDSTGVPYSGSISFGSAQQAVVFTTGPSGPFYIGELILGMGTYTAGSYDFTVGIRSVDGAYNPIGANIVSVGLNTGAMPVSTDRNLPLTFTSLGSLGAYGLASSTAYALVVELPPAASALGWGSVDGAFPSPDPQYGFSVQKNSVAWVGSWQQIYGPSKSYSMAIGPAEVPEPSTYVLLGLGLAALATRTRRRPKADGFGSPTTA